MEFVREIIQGVAYFFFMNFPGIYPIDIKMSPEQVFRASLNALAKNEISFEECAQFSCESLEDFFQKSTCDLSLQNKTIIEAQLNAFKQAVLITSGLTHFEMNQAYSEFKAKFGQQLRGYWAEEMAKTFYRASTLDLSERLPAYQQWTLQFANGVEYFSHLQERLPTELYRRRLVLKTLYALKEHRNVEAEQKAKSFVLQRQKESPSIYKGQMHPSSPPSFKLMRQDLERCIFALRMAPAQKPIDPVAFSEALTRIFSTPASKL